MARLLVLFHSFYGNIFRLSESVVAGARDAGAEVEHKQVPENVPEDVLSASGALEAKKAFAHIPVATVDELPSYDGIAIGTGTRFGNMTSTMRSFWDQTGKHWQSGALAGKVATVFAATGTGGGRETTVVSTWYTLAHHGMIIVPAGYLNPNSRNAEEVHGFSPYGASVVSRAAQPRPSELEAEVARSQGRFWAETAIKMFG